MPRSPRSRPSTRRPPWCVELGRRRRWDRDRRPPKEATHQSPQGRRIAGRLPLPPLREARRWYLRSSRRSLPGGMRPERRSSPYSDDFERCEPPKYRRAYAQGPPLLRAFSTKVRMVNTGLPGLVRSTPAVGRGEAQGARGASWRVGRTMPMSRVRGYSQRGRTHPSLEKRAPSRSKGISATMTIGL